ncbi:MAG: type II toxin-antitoxin system VapB family antitoxin [Myxococcaceae bacterium]
MVTHMKTTIEISDALLAEARKLASKEHATLRELVEEGLRAVVENRKGPRSFALRKASFKGKGLQPGIGALGWAQLRDLAYEGRGA